MNIINRVVCGPVYEHSLVKVYQEGRVSSYSLGELDSLANKVCTLLSEQGFEEGDRIGILASNSVEWVVLDLACIKAKLVTAAFDPQQFNASIELARRYDLKALFTDASAPPEISADDLCWFNISKLLEECKSLPPSVSREGYAGKDITTIKFTSGSTGIPKGLAATVASIDGSISVVQDLFSHSPSDVLFVFLPLSLLQQRYWIYSAYANGHNVVVSAPEYALYALKREQPTIIMGVPGFYESLKNQVQKFASVKKTSAQEILRQHLGDNVRYLWTGSAPISRSTLSFFTDSGFPIYEGYGMNETCIVTKNYPGCNRIGSVGKVVKGKSIYFDSRGVIHVKSQNPVNTAYLFCAEGESERIFTPEGDVVTGDLGYLDDDGYLYITGRAVDEIVLSSGKNVMPRPIEERIKDSTFVADCVLYGNGRNFLSAIVVPAVAPAKEGSAQVDSYEKEIDSHIRMINQNLAKHERVAKFIVADDGFSQESGLSTNQHKPIRKNIFKYYQNQLEQCYGVN